MTMGEYRGPGEGGAGMPGEPRDPWQEPWRGGRRRG